MCNVTSSGSLISTRQNAHQRSTVPCKIVMDSIHCNKIDEFISVKVFICDGYTENKGSNVIFERVGKSDRWPGIILSLRTNCCYWPPDERCIGVKLLAL